MRHMNAVCPDFGILPEYNRDTSPDEISPFIQESFELTKVCIFRTSTITEIAPTHQINMTLMQINKHVKRHGIVFLDEFVSAVTDGNDISHFDTPTNKTTRRLLQTYQNAVNVTPTLWNALMRLYDEFGVLPTELNPENLVDGKICNLEFGNGAMAKRLNQQLNTKNIPKPKS